MRGKLGQPRELAMCLGEPSVPGQGRRERTAVISQDTSAYGGRHSNTAPGFWNGRPVKSRMTENVVKAPPNWGIWVTPALRFNPLHRARGRA